MAKKVVIYTTDHCPYCRAAKELLASKGVMYEEIDITNDEIVREKVAALSDRQTVPQIFADGVSIGGYEDLVRFYRDGKAL